MRKYWTPKIFTQGIFMFLFIFLYGGCKWYGFIVASAAVMLKK